MLGKHGSPPTHCPSLRPCKENLLHPHALPGAPRGILAQARAAFPSCDVISAAAWCWEGHAASLPLTSLV